jgi:hypothetical protein
MKGVWSENQAQLFFALLKQRQSQRQIGALANIPIYLWLHWGDDYVPQRQLRRAMRTYAQGATRASTATINQVILPQLTKAFGVTRVSGVARTAFTEAVKALLSQKQSLNFGEHRDAFSVAARMLVTPNGTSLELPMVEHYLDTLETVTTGLAPFLADTDRQIVSGPLLEQARLRYRATMPEYEDQARLTLEELHERYANGAGNALSLFVGVALQQRSDHTQPGHRSSQPL